ncbi:MAG: hypothetical protein AAB821_01360 [Patescibacteria group bacterium]
MYIIYIMITQVVFKINKELKDQAMKKARQEGLAFGAVLKLATKAFVAGTLDVGLVVNEKFNPKVQREIAKALQEITTNRGLSPGFTTTKEAVGYLRGL